MVNDIGLMIMVYLLIIVFDHNKQQQGKSECEW